MWNNGKNLLLAKFKEKIKQQSLDAFLITNPYNIFYLTNLRIEGALILSPGANILITSPLYAEEVSKNCHNWQIEIQKESLYDSLLHLWKNLETMKIGFESSHISYQQYQKLITVGRHQFIPCQGVVESLRLIKEEKELAFIKRAFQATLITLDYLEGKLQPGITERQLYNQAVNKIHALADEVAFPPIILFGKRTSLPHGRPSERKLNQGEGVLLDIGAKVENYCADLTRTVFFGEIDPEWQEIYNLVERAQIRGFEEIRPGEKASRIDQVIREVIEKAGYGNSFFHGSGHGVGLEVHEQPFLNRHSTHILRAGMVVTVEPGIYLPGKGGIRLEKMVLITDKEGEILK